MRVSEAKQMVVDLISRDLAALTPPSIQFDPLSPDGDPGKFWLDGRAARVIHHFSGWFVPIDLAWFHGGFDPPKIQGGPFYWYAFAIPGRYGVAPDHYFICDYLQMRDWVLDFTAPLGNDHRDHKNWRADLRVVLDDPEQRTGYFRWGDEPVGVQVDPRRFIELDNVMSLTQRTLTQARVGVFGPGGEGTAHRNLKLYVAAHGRDFGLSEEAIAVVEHRFRTGDRVDVLFQNHWPERTVVEVEVSGMENICTGIHQAVKYRSLAEVEGGYEPWGSTVRSLVVAYDTRYDEAETLAGKYGVDLVSVDPNLVLGAVV